MSSLFDLRGRIAIVTGGNGGIGLGMARGLANAGASVVVAARNPEKSSAADRELQALGADALAVSVDVADEKSVDAMVGQAVAWRARLDILVNNAGRQLLRHLVRAYQRRRRDGQTERPRGSKVD